MMIIGPVNLFKSQIFYMRSTLGGDHISPFLPSKPCQEGFFHFSCGFFIQPIPSQRGTIGLDRFRGWIPADQLRDGYTPWSLNMVYVKISCWERSLENFHFQVNTAVQLWFYAWAGPQTPGSSPWIPWRAFFFKLANGFFTHLVGHGWHVRWVCLFCQLNGSVMGNSPRLSKAANTETTQLVNGLCPYLRDNEKALMCLASFSKSDGKTEVVVYNEIWNGCWLMTVFPNVFDTIVGGLEGFWKDRITSPTSQPFENQNCPIFSWILMDFASKRWLR